MLFAERKLRRYSFLRRHLRSFCEAGRPLWFDWILHRDIERYREIYIERERKNSCQPRSDSCIKHTEHTLYTCPSHRKMSYDSKHRPVWGISYGLNVRYTSLPAAWSCLEGMAYGPSLSFGSVAYDFGPSRYAVASNHLLRVHTPY
jgi:hypothetical protein